jgi:methionine-S-sulfoxide reductase/methionine-R-sulfoxide reductase
MIRILFLILLGVSMTAAETPTRSLVLGGGCFWCLEAAYELVPGVQAVTSGYAGGQVDQPSYEDVCDGRMGHAEVVRIDYDPAKVGVERLLQLFWKVHDPTTRNRQGNDVGTQYRSIVLAADDAQETAAKAAIAAEQAHWQAPIVTEVVRLPTSGPGRFHAAEDDHQDYFRRNPTQGYCRAVVRTKVAKMQEALRAERTVTVRDLGPDGRLGAPTPQPMVVRTPAEWKSLLSPEAYAVLRHEGTERPFCGGLLHEKGKGWFCCAGCGLPLFASNDKFESGTGWPSFTREAARENILRIEDRTHGMLRTEIRCARCDGHLGHVFDDGPAPTFTRHCLNSAALVFKPTP